MQTRLLLQLTRKVRLGRPPQRPSLIIRQDPMNGRIIHPRLGSAKNSGSTPLLRSEEHTSELQSHSDLVCRLLLEKKKKKKNHNATKHKITRITFHILNKL